jgi:L-arabinonolactonase
MNIQQIKGISTALGEGPYWDPVAQVLYLIDIREQLLLCYDPATGSVDTWATPSAPAAVSRTENDLLVVALADGFYHFDPDRGTFTLLARIEFGSDEEKLNDAKVDRQGRFVAGATNSQSGRPVAGIYSFDGRKVTRIVDSGFEVCNGPCWSPDGRTFYIADTGPNVIYAYDYDISTGTASRKRVFADVSAFDGLPDGGTVDSEGRVWYTFVMGGDLVAFNPDGSVHVRLPTGIRWMSSVQFGGPDYTTIFLTSMDPARVGMGETDPRRGALISIEGAGAVGLAEPLAAPFSLPSGN